MVPSSRFPTVRRASSVVFRRKASSTNCSRGESPSDPANALSRQTLAQRLQSLPPSESCSCPLVILFNRGRLMVLEQAVSKGTGLRDALHILRLSPHNAIAIGDAENDHALLAECELAAAVSWGSPTLQAEADQVLKGDGPSAVADYIRWATTKSRLPAGRAGRHPLMLGTAHDGQPVTDDVSGVNALIVGESQSGKSWATGLVCEQFIIQGYTLCVIDPEGDYGGLESLPGVLVLGG